MIARFISSLRASLCMLLIMSLTLGLIYPLLTFVVAQTLFHHRANGSLIKNGENIVGSLLLGQEFTHPKYFWSRMSATTPPYNPAASGGSNFSQANPKLLVAANWRIRELQKSDSGAKTHIPVELVTASASGLDPHISLTAAEYQVVRVARARGVKQADVKALVEKMAEHPGFGLLAEPYVNVVKLNIALDNAQAREEKR